MQTCDHVVDVSQDVSEEVLVLLEPVADGALHADVVTGVLGTNPPVLPATLEFPIRDFVPA